ncbi:MAG: DUF1501 domain-containing protein [Myxococcales bacterium]|nr:DUF1501 domain-containing protein [Myxococcales bacterium]
MSQTRREVLRHGLLGAGWVGLRAVATGLPIGLLLDPQRAEALATSSSPKARFLVLSLSTCGDPLNANVPGSYSVADIVHPSDPRLAATTLSIAGRKHQGARTWQQLGQKLLDRTVFFHHATLKTSHPSLPELLRVSGELESAPMLFAKELGPKLQTVSAEPLLIGVDEVVTVGNRRLGSVRPTELRDALLGPGSPLPQLTSLREETLQRLTYLRKRTGSAAIGRVLDAQALSAKQAAQLGERLLADLRAIRSDQADGQVLAAAVAARLGMSPVLAIHIPFGGDNHFDSGLVKEAEETSSGVGHIANLWSKLGSYGMADRVCFAHFSVFGRTLRRYGMQGRDHWPLHNAAILQGAPFRGGVVGGLIAQEGDYGAVAIDSKTGQGQQAGDIAIADGQKSLLRTLGEGLGIGAQVLTAQLPDSKAVRSALI